MTIRPNLNEETVERLDSKLQDVIRVEPEKVGMDEKISVVLDELESVEEEIKERDELNGKLDKMKDRLRSIERSVDNPNNRVQ